MTECCFDSRMAVKLEQMRYYEQLSQVTGLDISTPEKMKAEEKRLFNMYFEKGLKS